MTTRNRYLTLKMLSNLCCCVCLCSLNPDGFWCAHVRTVPILTKHIDATICYVQRHIRRRQKVYFHQNSIASWNRDNGKTKKRIISLSNTVYHMELIFFPWVPFVIYPHSNFMPMISCVIAFSCMLMLNDKIICAPARSMHWDQKNKKEERKKGKRYIIWLISIMRIGHVLVDSGGEHTLCRHLYRHIKWDAWGT